MDFKYRAFISYSHADHGWAVWLHKALETYKVPKQVVGLTTPVGTVPKKLGRVYRDEAEEGAASELGPRIEAALESADAQIIIASPRSAKSQWVDKEIRKYKSLGRETRIFVLIVDGEPHAKDPAQECFPDALKWKAGPDSTLSDEPAEPLAVDVRKFGKHDALVRLAAGILGLGYDDLKQRDLQRQRAAQRQAQALFAGALTLFTGAIVASALSIGQTKTVADRESLLFADRARQYAENGDDRRALLWAVGGLPDDSVLIKPDTAQARAQFIRSWNSHVRLTEEMLFRADFNTSGHVVTIDGNDVVTLWDTVTGEKLAERQPPGNANQYYIESIRFSPDGSTIWFLDGTGRIVFLDAKTLEDHQVLEGDYFDAAMLGDGRRMIVAGGEDGSAGILHLDTGRLLRLRGHAAPVNNVYAIADGSRALTLSEDGTAKVWDTDRGRELFTISTANIPGESLFTSAMISENGWTIVTFASRAGIFRWHGGSGEPLSINPETGGPLGIWDTYNRARPLALSPDGSMLAYSNTVGVFIQSNTSGRPQQLQGIAPGENLSAVFSPGGDYILVSDDMGNTGLWYSGSIVGRLDRDSSRILPITQITDPGDYDEEGYGDFEARVYVDPKMKKMLIASWDGTVVWDLTKALPLAELRDYATDIQQIVFSADGKTVHARTADGATKHYTASGLETLPDQSVISRTGDNLFAEQILSETALASPDGTRYLRALGSDRVRIIDAETDQILADYAVPVTDLNGYRQPVRQMQFSPDGSYLAVVNGSGDLFLYDGLQDISDMTVRDLRERGCAALIQYGLKDFDTNSPILDGMGAGGEALTSPCERRGLMSTDWWGPTLKSWWRGIFPSNDAETLTVNDG